MKEKILLVNPLFKNKEYVYFPVGLGYVAGACDQSGIEVECLDQNVGNVTNEQVLSKIKDNNYHIVGIGGFISQLRSTIELTNLIKNSNLDVTVVIGGIQVFGCEKFIFSNSKADIICMGESEILFPTLVHSLYQGKDISGIPSISYRKDNTIIENGGFSIIDNLDEISFPKYDAFDMEKYIKENYHGSQGTRTIDFICSRGCPYKCTYCINSKKPVKMRYRSVDNIMREIKFLKKEYDINDFSFGDEIFTVNKKKALEICEAIESENITWLTSVRADGIDEALLSAMKKAGCRMLIIGFESGSEKILRSMNKNVKKEVYYNSIKLLRKHGINIYANFMIGMPEENEETIRETEKFCIDNRLIYGASYVTPWPGTKLYDNVKDRINENEYLFSLGDIYFGKKPTINLTNMSTNKLTFLRNRTVVNTIANLASDKINLMPMALIKSIIWVYLLIFNITNPFIAKMIRPFNKLIHKYFQ